MQQGGFFIHTKPNEIEIIIQQLPLAAESCILAWQFASVSSLEGIILEQGTAS